MTQLPVSWPARLEWSVRALAQPKSVQETLFPGFVCVPDELALEFDESLRGFRETGLRLPDDASDAILALDRQLEAMSGAEHSDLWNQESLAHSSDWQMIRALAQRVVVLMQWPAAPPPPSGHIYVGSDGS